MKDRLYVAVDCENIWCSVRDKFGKDARLDFGKLLEYAKQGREMKVGLAKAYVVTDRLSRVNSFVGSLQHIGYEVELGYTHQPDGSKMDVALAVDAIKNLRLYSIFCLISGDGDFVPLVDYLRKDKGKRVEVISTKNDISGRLMRIADEVYFIAPNLIYRQLEGERNENKL